VIAAFGGFSFLGARGYMGRQSMFYSGDNGNENQGILDNEGGYGGYGSSSGGNSYSGTIGGDYTSDGGNSYSGTIGGDSGDFGGGGNEY
jgi:hypothetical protein